MPHNTNPFTGYNFMVALGDIGGEDEIAGGFQEVAGLGVSIDQVEYRVGNEKSSGVRTFAGLRRYSNVTLKRGFLTDTRLWDWIATDPPDKRTVVITLLDEQRVPQVRFVLRQAWPCKWTGPDLDATSSAVAIESVELTHEGLEVSMSVAEPARESPQVPEVVLDVEARAGAFVLVLANTGTTTAFEPRVVFDTKLTGLRGELMVSELPVWTGLAMLRPGCQIDVLLDAQSAQRAPEQRRFTVTVTYRDGAGRGFERACTHDLDAYDGLPSLLP